MSKVSIQFVGYKPDKKISAAADALIARRAHAVKVVNRLDLAFRFARELPPDSLIVFRDQAWQARFQSGLDERLVDDVNAEVRTWLDHHLLIANACPRLVTEITNEWSGGWYREGGAWISRPKLIRAFSEFEAKVAQGMAAAGHRVVMGNYAVSHPPYEAARYMTESLLAAEKYKSYWGFHCYNSPRLDSSLGGDGKPDDFLFRYNTWWQAANGYTLYPNVKLLVTEFGIDDIGGNGYAGWRRVKGLTAQAMAEQIYNYADPIFNRHDKLRAVFWYRLGHDRDDVDGDATFDFDAMDYADPPRSEQDLWPHILRRISPAGELSRPGIVEVPPPVGQLSRHVVVLPGDGLRLRAGPSATDKVLAVLPKGTMLNLTGERSGKWREVSCWVHEDYIGST